MREEPLWFSAAGAAACAAGFVAASRWLWAQLGLQVDRNKAAGAAGLDAAGAAGLAGSTGFAAAGAASGALGAVAAAESVLAGAVGAGAVCSISALGSASGSAGFSSAWVVSVAAGAAGAGAGAGVAGGWAIQRKLNHILDDGNFRIQQINHQLKVNTAYTALIHYARSALGIDLDVFKFHEAAGVLTAMRHDREHQWNLCGCRLS